MKICICYSLLVEEKIDIINYCIVAPIKGFVCRAKSNHNLENL